MVVVMEPSDPQGGAPFNCTSRADGSIVIRYRAAPVTILRGRAAERFSERLDRTDAAGAQQLMARATGNFRRGNERARGPGRGRSPGTPDDG